MAALRTGRLTSPLLLAVLIASCTSPSTSASTSTAPTTAPTTTTTTTTTTVPDDCTGEGWMVDLDGSGGAEAVLWRPLESGGLHVEICQDGVSVAGIDIDGPNTEPLGVVDLGDGGILDLIVTTTVDDRIEVRGVTLGLGGLLVTDVLAERWIDGPFDGVRLFEARGFECADIDADGQRELLAVTYVPADTLDGDVAMHVRVGTVVFDGDVSTFGVDAYEAGLGVAHERWVDDPRCAPDSSARVEVRSHPNGWGRLDAGETFAGPGNLIMTGIAHSADLGRFVMVGAESPSLLLGEFFENRPSIWYSADAIDWMEADLGEARGEVRAVADLPGGAGFVAVGSSGLVPMAWVSSDGIEWRAVEVPMGSDDPIGLIGPVMSAVVVTPLGIFAVGTEDLAPPTFEPGLGPDLDAAVWVSSDGVGWRRIDHPAFGSAGYQPNTDGEFNSGLVDVIWSPGIGVVAVGSASESDPSIDFPPEAPMVWVSSDGETWTRHPLNLDIRARGIAPVEGGVIAFGVDGIDATPTSDAVVAWSADGVVWRLGSGPFSGLSEADGVQAGNDGLLLPGGVIVLIGSDEVETEARGGAAVWWSNDGYAWDRERHDDGAFGTIDAAGTATMTAGVWDGERLVVVGFSGRSVEFPGGIIGCCVLEPAVWYWPMEGESSG